MILRFANTHLINSNSRNLVCLFSRQEQKKKKGEAPKPEPKSMEEYIRGPAEFKKNLLEVKQMQTTSIANVEEESLRSIIVEQRTRLH